MKRYTGKAMVLGGAAGLGAAFARELAMAGYALWLVDRRADALPDFAQELSQASGATVETLALDLAAEGADQRLEALIRQEDIALLVYVAAYSHIGGFPALTEAQRQATLGLNVNRMVAISHAFVSARCRRGQAGGLILISSLAGFWGLPGVGLYGATKAFTWNFAEGLQQEVSRLGIDVLGLICGAMDTPGLRDTRPNLQGMLLERPETAAREALRMLGRKSLWVAGWRSRLVFHLFNRLLPRSLARRVMARHVRRMYPGRVPPGNGLG